MEKKKILQLILIACVVVMVAIVLALLLRKNNDEQIIVKKPLNEKVNLEQVFAEIEKIYEPENLDELENPMIGEEQENSDEELENSDIEGSEIEDDSENINNEFSEKEKTPPEEEIDFGKYTVLEKKAMMNTTEEKVNEVWMIKLGSYEQQEEVCRIFGNRLQKLRNNFENDEVQKQILEQAVIKQEDGIAIMIASPEKNQIEETIANAMK